MKLLDTSIWIDHLRSPDPEVRALLRARRAWMHPLVLGEIAMGNLARRELTLEQLSGIRTPMVASDAEVRELIELERLFGSGLGYVDAHLLASSLCNPGLVLWTRDRRLAQAADRLGVAA